MGHNHVPNIEKLRKFAEHLILKFQPKKVCYDNSLLLQINVFVSCILLNRINFYCSVVFCNY